MPNGSQLLNSELTVSLVASDGFGGGGAFLLGLPPLSPSFAVAALSSAAAVVFPLDRPPPTSPPPPPFDTAPIILS